MQCRLRSIVLGIAAFAASTVIAADHPVAGDTLSLKDPVGKPEKRQVSFKANRDLAIDPSQAGDPRLLGATGPIALPAGAFWKGLGNPPGSKGYKYYDKNRAFGGIKQVNFKPGSKGGQLQISGGGLNWAYAVTQPQTAVAVRFAIGTETYCGNFTQFTKNDVAKVQAKNAAVPPSCTPPVCGDGVAAGAEECDDGGVGNGDGCSSLCQLENTTALCAGVPATGGTDIHSIRVASGLEAPVFVTAPRLDPHRLFVLEQDGRIRIIKNGILLPTPFLAIESLVNGGPNSEQGLLGLAFHPNYESNGRFFVSYTTSSGGAHSEIAEYAVSGNPDIANGTGTVILTGAADFAGNHNGGMIAFGPDGFLYYGMGDGGGGDDPLDTGQDDASFFGKMYKIDVDDPPLANPLSDVFAKGLRNPWRFSFDRGTGDLYIGDVGQNRFEEINYQAAPLTAGVNWGWDLKEGRHCHFESGDPACPPSAPGLTDPVLEYCHSFGNDMATCGSHEFGSSVTGGYVYRGCAMSGMQGVYFYGDLSGFINTFQGVSGGNAQNVTERSGDLDPATGGFGICSISSFGEDARGEIYIVDYGSGGFDGEIFKIVPGP